MICAYCGNEGKGTKEHIISCGVLDLFPECFATVDHVRGKVYESDPMVKDVCPVCNNNRLSYIDSYAKDIIEKYFLKKFERDETLLFQYDYTLMQKMCLKYAFNDLRSKKKDTSFFDDSVKHFLLSAEETFPLRNVTLLAGLAVNTSPAPDFVFGNLKLRWSDSPMLLSNSLVRYVDPVTGQIYLNEKMEQEHFEKCALSYVFRFNSLQLLLICWEKDIDDALLEQNNVVLKFQYPYTMLDSNGESDLSRCTSEITYHNEMLIDVTWGQGMMDEISWMRGTFSEKSKEYFSLLESEWKKEEQLLAAEHPRKE